ncbi:hypothetical protein IEQ34_018814 [Dendrobium chrysotoxum]|uniref:Uncharacterized protein n=1 Tax=Dendrobium chrysotoxum TaxID=161865 RepID=A0AAV7FPG2_DENCH|nr:hypothetical protein IEQ34_018814 [Dendrobium chrysotoxum]
MTCMIVALPWWMSAEAFPWFSTSGIPYPDLGPLIEQNPLLSLSLLPSFLFLYGRLSLALDKRYPLSNYKAPPYIEAILVDHLPSRDHAAQNGGERRPNKGAKLDYVASTVTSDSLIVLHKKFHFPNDLVATVPKKFDRAYLPPSGYMAVYETSLQGGLRFSAP